MPIDTSQFGAMTLAVIERQREKIESFRARNGRDRGRIEPAGKQDDCGCWHANFRQSVPARWARV